MTRKCYLCDQVFGSVKTIPHGEHVIQNSLGGALIAYDILCEECGSKLGSVVDKQFAIALSPLTVLLQPRRDHGEHQSRTAARVIAKSTDAAPLEQVQLVLQGDFSVIPVRPILFKDEDRRTVTVLGATEKQATQYAKSPLVQAAIASGYALEVGTNAAAYAQSVLVPVSPNSLEVLRGVLKIAIGYASHNGVSRAVFDHLLAQGDLTSSEPILRSSVFPYYPTTDAERLFETEKHTHEDWYPTHHLYLFNQGSDLYCYVELFGAIQKYVHLSSAYNGPPLMRKFVQKAEKWDFDEGTFTARDPKDLHILAGEFGVETNGRPWGDIQKDVLHQARSRAYSLEPEETVEKVQKLVLLLAEFSLLPNGAQFEVVRSMFDKANTAKAHLGLSLLDDLKADPMIALGLVKKDFADFRVGDAKSSCPEQSRQVPSDAIDRYAAYKLYELLRAKGRESELQYQLV